MVGLDPELIEELVELRETSRLLQPPQLRPKVNRDLSITVSTHLHDTGPLPDSTGLVQHLSRFEVSDRVIIRAMHARKVLGVKGVRGRMFHGRSAGRWLASMGLVAVGCPSPPPDVMAEGMGGTFTGGLLTGTTSMLDSSTATSDNRGGNEDDPPMGPTTSDADSDDGDSATGTPVPQSVITVLDEYLVPQDQTLVVIATGGVLQNDSQIDRGELEATVANARTEHGGEVSMTPDGAFRYIPPARYWGEDGFDYIATDVDGNASTGHARVVVAPTAIDLNEVIAGTGGFCIQGEAPALQSAQLLSVGGNADVNGDGFADIIIGDPDLNNSEGQGYVVFGSADPGPVELAALDDDVGIRVTPEANNDRLGMFAIGSGDVNGDGFADFALGGAGNYAYANGQDAHAYVLFGGPQGGALPLQDIVSDTDGRGFRAAGSAGPATRASGGGGDINGDGLSDLVIGTPAGTTAPAYVVFGANSGASVRLDDMNNGGSARGFAIVPGNSDVAFGSSASMVGDVNGDGRADIVVGVSGSASTPGRAFVIFGKTGTEPAQFAELGSTTAGFAIDGEANGDSAGFTVGGAGDVNGDGLADILIGAPGADVSGGSNNGRGYVLFGRATEATVQLSAIARGEGGFAVTGPSGSRLGAFVSSAGDLDGDGLDDVAFGMPSFDESRGQVVVIYGTQSGGSFTSTPSADQGFTILGTLDGGRTGETLAAAGDVNRDGFADFVVGSPRAGANGTGSDQICVLFGGDYTLRAP